MAAQAASKAKVLEVTVTVSAPYRVIGYHGGRYGASQFQRRDYRATVLGTAMELTSKHDMQQQARIHAFREGGFTRVIFTFVPGEG